MTRLRQLPATIALCVAAVFSLSCASTSGRSGIAERHVTMLEREAEANRRVAELQSLEIERLSATNEKNEAELAEANAQIESLAERVQALEHDLAEVDAAEKLQLVNQIRFLERALEEHRGQEFLNGMQLVLNQLSISCRPITSERETFFGKRKTTHLEVTLLCGAEIVYRSRWNIEDSSPASGRAAREPLALAKLLALESIFRAERQE